MMHRSTQIRKNHVLEAFATAEVPALHEFRQLLIMLQLNQLGQRSHGEGSLRRKNRPRNRLVAAAPSPTGGTLPGAP